MNDDDMETKRPTSGPYNYEDGKRRIKKKFYVTNKLNEYPRNSNYSSSSKYTSFVKGNIFVTTQAIPSASPKSYCSSKVSQRTTISSRRSIWRGMRLQKRLGRR